VISLASLALATLAFVGSHFAMSHPLRRRLIGIFGEAGFSLFYSIVSAVTLLWMILSYRSLDAYAPMWIAPDWWWNASSGVMLVALILLVGSLIRNPAFPHPGAQPEPPKAAAGVFAITRHPMNWAFILWALVHLSVWGSVPNLIVGGGILILALFGSIGQDRKKVKAFGAPWRQWMDRTSFVPFAALVTGRASWRAAMPHWIALVGGTALWLLLTWYHDPAPGVTDWVFGG
jgi:uncharacterized membrane protein